MIVVAIVGVLAVLATYGVRKYIANAKTAEARNSLGQIGKDAVTAYEGERVSAAVMMGGDVTSILRSMCQTGSADQGVPSTVGNIEGKKYQSKKEDWAPIADVTSNLGWPCLKFEMTAPQYYQYKYAATGVDTGSFVASAIGDLNGDQQYSTFSLQGAIESGRLKLAPAIGEISPEE